MAAVKESESRRGFLSRTAGAGLGVAVWSGTGGADTGARPATRQTAVATDEDWPMFQHDAYNSGTLSTTVPSEPVEAVWSF